MTAESAPRAHGAPDRFGAYEKAETFCQRFFPWYNLEHRLTTRDSS